MIGEMKRPQMLGLGDADGRTVVLSEAWSTTVRRCECSQLSITRAARIPGSYSRRFGVAARVV